jgi:hypothetical protein
MIFESERWPLHTALAWVLTRDRSFTERFLAWPHHPCLINYEPFFPAVDMHWSWKELFAALVDGSIPVFGRPTINMELPEKPLSAEDLKGLDWANPREISLALTVPGRPWIDNTCIIPGLRRRVAMWLNADREFTIPDDIAFIDVYLDATAVQKRFPPGSKAIACDSREFGVPEPATGPGFMGVTSAAYLIATEGGLHNFFLRDTDEWAHAYKALLSHVAQGTIEIIGRPAETPFHQKLDGKLFSSVFIRFYLDDPAIIQSGSEPVLDCSYPKSATDQTLPYYAAGSRFGGDRLLVNGNAAFSDLQVLKSDVADAFPFVEARREMISKRRVASKLSTRLPILRPHLGQRVFLDQIISVSIANGSGQMNLRERLRPSAMTRNTSQLSE